MKHITLIALLLSLLLSACTPSIMATPTPTTTLTPTPLPTKTPRPTPLPAKIYTLEVGVCLQFLRDLTGDPKNAGCTPIQRTKVTFKAGQNAVTVSIDSNEFYPYCALYNSSGKLVAKNIAPSGSSSITCQIP